MRMGALAWVAIDTEEGSEEDQKKSEDDTRVLKMLYEGSMEEVNRRAEQQRKSNMMNHKHPFCRHTRCTSTAQEEQSALPIGVIHVNEDSSGEED